MTISRIALLALCGAFVVAVLATPALAQDAETESKKPDRTLGDNIKDSMPIGGIIILMSIAMAGLVIEHFVNIRRDKIIPPEVIGELEVLFDEEDYEGALQFCDSTPGIVTNVVGAALPRMSQGFGAMRSALEEVGEEEAVKLQGKISFLSLIGTLGPMLGLFGTVTGMVTAFNVIATKSGGANPADLAGGISQALMTTVLGLMVAIPAMGFYFYFKNKVTRLVLEAGVISSELVDRFRPVE